ncbi:MAG: hypothetical protein JWM80_5893 [Cyanobacteria bacterium RYN_339]|nr:hypothetical protein [Cyanobacteria bacterium RYN_339]
MTHACYHTRVYFDEAAAGTGHVSISSLPPVSIGAEAVLGVTTLPFRLGISAAYAPHVAGGLAGWIEEGVPVGDVYVGALGGVNNVWSPDGQPDQPGAFLGAYLMAWANDSTWVRFTPNLTVYPLDPLRSLVAGPAWLEVGWVIRPHVVLSLRSSLTPIKLSVGF